MTGNDDDPRWQRMSDNATSAMADAAAGNEFARLFQEYVTTAEAVAADKVAPAADRALARRILARIDAELRANLPALLASLARTVCDPTLADDIRAEFDDMLARATEHMPAASATRH
jgi:hypothetical protein